ncbi:MAG: hypothetical protein GY694_20000 [Gammaproteobacteria bacterium]|nr:hypothetical protein [Gammaproteobacteria bacterium]
MKIKKQKKSEKYIMLSLVISVILFISMSSHSRPFGSNISSHVSNAIKKQVRAAIVPTLSTKKNKIESPTQMQLSKDQRYLTLLMSGNYISVWDMKNGKEVDHFSVKELTIEKIVVDPWRKKIYIINDQGKLFSKKMVFGEKISSLNKIQKKYWFNNISINKKHLAISTKDNQLLIYKSNVENIINFKAIHISKIKIGIDEIKLLPGKQKIIISGNDKTLSIYDFNHKLKLIQKLNVSGKVKKILTNKDGTSIAVWYENGRFAYTRKKDQKFLNLKTVEEKIIAINLNKDQINILTKDNDSYQKNIKTDKKNYSKKITQKEINTALFFNNGHYLLLPTKNNGINLFDIKSASKIAQILSTKSGWAVLDAKGRYDGNEDALHDVSWDADGHLIELDQLAEKYFEPGLLKKVVVKDKKMITTPAATIEKGIYLPPVVNVNIVTNEKSFQLPGKIKLQITAKVTDKYQTLHEPSVYHNGKKIPQEKLHLNNSEQKGEIGIKEWSLTVPAVAGLNGFNVEVKGWQEISGQSQQVIFNARQTTQQIASSQPARVFMKSIGINDYQDESLALDFAVADASEIVKTFSASKLSKNNSSTNKVTTLMLNQKATKKSILSLLDKTKKASGQNDMLIVFMSGHGVVVNNQWYFLPHEAQSLRDKKHIQRVGLSAKELMSKFIDIPSQKIVLIIDACQSGAVTNDFNNFHQRRALRGLSQETGIHIIAATRADQLAPEFGELGHGLFTYTLLNGMKINSQGTYNADQWPKDGQLMVSELQRYTEKFVPALAHAMAARHYGSSGERGALDERTMVTPVGSSQGYDFIVYQ